MALRKPMRLMAVVAATGISRPSIYRMMAEGTFPTGTLLSVRVRIWYEDEIAAYQNGEWKPAEAAA